MTTSVLSMLVDPANTSAGSAIQSVWGRSPRLLDLQGVEFARLAIGAQVLTPTGVGAWIKYAVTYSTDGGVNYNLLMPWSDPIPDVFTNMRTPWVPIDPVIANAGDIWIRGEYQQYATGGTTTCTAFDLHLR